MWSAQGGLAWGITARGGKLAALPGLVPAGAGITCLSYCLQESLPDLVERCCRTLRHLHRRSTLLDHIPDDARNRCALDRRRTPPRPGHPIWTEDDKVVGEFRYGKSLISFGPVDVFPALLEFAAVLVEDVLTETNASSGHGGASGENYNVELVMVAVGGVEAGRGG